MIYQTAESNEMMYSKVAMGGSGYDVVVPSDYMIAQMIEEACWPSWILTTSPTSV